MLYNKCITYMHITNIYNTYIFYIHTYIYIYIHMPAPKAEELYLFSHAMLNMALRVYTYTAQYASCRAIWNTS